MPNIGDKILGRYQIKRELGSGNFATVYLAYDEKLKRDVAIKVISAAKSPDPGAALNTLLREAHIIAALQHPNILKIFDYQIDCEEGYLIMEYAEGGTLADILKQHSNKRLSEPKNKRSLYSFEETLRVRGNFSKKQELITLLLECPSIANRANRDLLIREVRNGAIFATFARDAVDRIDVANIVNKLLEYSGALEELISFIKLVDSGTKALQDLETFRGVLLVDSLPSDSLTLEEATSYFSDIVKGVNHAHANNVIHFDLKPENIMFVQGRPVIGDFGVAKVISSTGTIALTKLPGTPYYTAPESWDNKGNKSSDVYSLGIILYQMLAGEPPFEGNTAQLCKKHLYDPLPNLISKRPDLPIGFQSFLEFLTAKDPHARPSADKILELLEEALLTLSLPKASTNSNIPKSNTASVASQVQANTPQTTAPPQKPPSPTPTKAPATPPSQPPAAPPKPKGQIGGKLKPFGFVSVAVILIILGLLTLQPFGKGNPASSEGQTTATATGVVPTPTKAALITFPANTTVPPTLAPTITPAPPTLAPT
ncbi:MAG: serine/threonine protein kinase, partial [Chloroflexi bacterium]|nr:serine/threonine protein kinase [Chloroflexota bacterium]